PAERQAQEGRGRVLLVDRLQVAQAARQRPEESHEGQAPRLDDGPQEDAVRRQADDLRGVQGRRRGITDMKTDQALRPASELAKENKVRFPNESPEYRRAR